LLQIIGGKFFGFTPHGTDRFPALFLFSDRVNCRNETKNRQKTDMDAEA
jgi:hypothetical protein